MPLATRRRGFTLLELVMVLVILTVLATVALEALEPQVDQARFEATQRTIREVEGAIFSRSTGTDGRQTLSGFYIDMGRFPRAVDEGGRLTLAELWQGAGLPAYTALAATPATLATTRDDDGDPVAADSQVRLHVGWRGPYLQLPLGAAALRDGWGHELAADGGYSHLRGPGDMDVSLASPVVVGVRSLGRDDQPTPPPADVYDQELPAVQPGSLPWSQASLEGIVSGRLFVRTGGGSPSPGDLVVQIYYPDPTQDGKLAVQRATLTPQVSPQANYDLFDFRFLDGSGQEKHFHIGTRVIRGYYLEAGPDSSQDFGDGSGDPPRVSQPRSFTVFPGHNSLDLTIN